MGKKLSLRVEPPQALKTARDKGLESVAFMEQKLSELENSPYNSTYLAEHAPEFYEELRMLRKEMNDMYIYEEQINNMHVEVELPFSDEDIENTIEAVRQTKRQYEAYQNGEL